MKTASCSWLYRDTGPMTPPSLQGAVCSKLLLCGGCMLFFLTVTRSLPIMHNVDPHFISHAPFLTRLVYAFFSIQAARPKFYFAWTLGKGTVVLAWGKHFFGAMRCERFLCVTFCCLVLLNRRTYHTTLVDGLVCLDILGFCCYICPNSYSSRLLVTSRKSYRKGNRIAGCFKKHSFRPAWTLWKEMMPERLEMSLDSRVSRFAKNH